MVQLTQEDATVVYEYDYDTFGNQLVANENDNNPLRYNGQYWDEETQTYYLRARQYNPVSGRFTTEDTHWTVGNMIYDENGSISMEAILQAGNLYAYCMGNPVMYQDSSGKLGVLATIAIGAVVGALISGGYKMMDNIKSGEAWNNDLGLYMISGGAGGAVSAIPIPGVNVWVSTAITGAAGNLTSELIVGEIQSVEDVVSVIGIGVATGVLGEASAEILSKGFQDYFKTLTKSQQKKILSNIGEISNRELVEIRQALKKGIYDHTLDELVKKYGYDTIINSIVSSIATEEVE